MPKLGRTGEHLLLENAIRRRTGALLASAFRSFFSYLQPSFFFYSFLLYFLSFSIFFPLFSSSELITSSSLFFFFLNHNIYYRTQFYSFQRKILGHDSNSKLDPFSKLFRALPLIDHDAPMHSQIRVSGGIQWRGEGWLPARRFIRGRHTISRCLDPFTIRPTIKDRSIHRNRWTCNRDTAVLQ